MRRRDFLKLAGTASLVGASGCHRLARPADPDRPLSREAEALLDRCWQGLDPARVLDVHAHVVGLGAGGTGAFVNPKLRSFWHPLERARFSIYVTAAGVRDLDHGDAEYVARLVHLVRSQPRHGRLMVLGFDKAYREDGTEDLAATEFYTPNDWVLSLAREYPDCFVAAASVHPYRKDALDELERVAEMGAIAVKWLPNAHGMDPGSPRCDAFYDRLAALKLPLVTHAGEEKAVDAEEAQRYGNPLKLRRALDRGVTVIVAHCASLGTNPDLDAPGDEKPEVSNLDLFLRIMENPAYEGRVFGEVSALGQYNRCSVIRELLPNEALHARFVNGSDYPLPAIHALVRTRDLVKFGYITEEERGLLNEIDQHNPLAFDFALKRLVRVRKGGREFRFPDSAFMPGADLFPRLAASSGPAPT